MITIQDQPFSNMPHTVRSRNDNDETINFNDIDDMKSSDESEIKSVIDDDILNGSFMFDKVKPKINHR